MKKTIALIIIYFLMSINISYAYTPSSWAQEEVAELKSTGYFDVSQFSEYQEPITRKKFIYFAARLFEIMSGNEIQVDSNMTFNDSTDIWALKGATVGITSGSGNGNFEPNSILTREQFATMIIRIMNLGDLTLSKPGLYKFNDDSDISLWAKEAIYIAKENGILSGVGNDMSAPKENATVEQCIILINRILKNNRNMTFSYNGINNIIPYKINFVKRTFSNSSYYGQMENGVYNGYGRLEFDNGAMYAGEWVNGKLNGQGKSILTNGDTYFGEFKDGKYDGYGTVVLHSGLTYVGEFKDNLYNGLGTYSGLSADYKGEFINGEIKYGTLTITDAIYTGEFDNYVPNGSGTMVFKFGEYSGDFEDGYMKKGTFIWTNGDKYIGEFKDNLFNGYGTYIKADGTFKTGQWLNDEFVE